MKKITPAHIRTGFQILYTIITNGYAYGFMSGKIYKGPLKYACVPGLNCYSCPGAVASCPLGALQNALNKRNFEVPFAILGFFFVFGSIFGRFVCGWLCPFGLVQDLLYKIPLFKKRKQLPKHHILKYGKYVMLVGLVCIGSAFLFSGFAKIPAFCKYLCPSGTLFGAIPLLTVNKMLQSQIGGLFFWKLAVLLAIVLTSIKVYRPFCQYLCPLGAIYGWFNKFSLVQIRWEKEACISCGKCKDICPVNLPPEEISTSAECIRCGKCVDVCPAECLQFCGRRRTMKNVKLKHMKMSKLEKNGKKQGWLIAVAILLITAVACVWYVNDYYHAEDYVSAYLNSSETVTVTTEDDIIFLDGIHYQRRIAKIDGGCDCESNIEMICCESLCESEAFLLPILYR